MSVIHSYLCFNGNCREAMEFYRECLGGELELQPVGTTPLAEKMPKKMKDCILHATLRNDRLVLMGSDMVPDEGLIRGNAMSLMLDCNSKKEINERYKKLSSGGTAIHPLELGFFGAIIGSLADKFGNRWLLHYQPVK